MAGGPIFPYSAKPDTAGRVFPYFGSSGNDTEGLGVEASVGADSTWKLRFQMPPSLPTGTGKLLLELHVNATIGNAKVNPKWKSCAAGEDFDAATLTAEGTSTITAAATANQMVSTKIALDADTLVAGEAVVMDLVFETTSWTLAAISTWVASIIWE